MTTILAIDPGARQKKGTFDVRGTGIAVLQLHETAPPRILHTELLPGGVGPLIEAMLNGQVPVGHHLYWADIVIVENFTLLEARANIEPLEMVGAVRGIGAAQGKTVVVQNPADRTIVSHDDLKRIGMWPGGAGHADEAQAVRHALAWALKTGNRPTVELLAPDSEDDAPTVPSSW